MAAPAFIQKLIAPWKVKTYSLSDIGVEAGAFSSWRPQSHVESAYEKNAIAYACIKRIATDVAGVPVMFLRDPDDDTSWVDDTDPTYMLFTRPNQVFTLRRLIEWTVMFRQLRGECFWLMDVGRGATKKIYPWYDPLGWKERVSRTEGLTGWDFRQGDTTFNAMPSEVLWFGNLNPRNPYRGLSPLSAAAGALGIDNTADNLQGDTLARGGERGLLLSTEMALDEEQIAQHRRNLAARRPGNGKASRDIILPDGLALNDPKFTREDLNFLNMQNMSKRKICAVYGMAPVLIGDDESAQYKSAPEAIKLYWRQTLLPLLRSIEDTWDAYFLGVRNTGVYVRFDLSEVTSLREDDQNLALTARVHHQMGISLVEINDRLGLGYSPEAMEAADAAKKERESRAAEMWLSRRQPGVVKAAAKLDNATIKARYHDISTKLQRDRMLQRLHKMTYEAISALGVEYGRRAAAAVRATAMPIDDMTGRHAAAKIRELEGDLSNDLVGAVEPGMTRAAEIGIVSIQDLVTGKAAEPWHDRRKQARFSPEVDEVMRLRRRLVLQAAVNWIDSMLDFVAVLSGEIATSGGTLDELAAGIRTQFEQVGRSRAQTIAATELGTIYNVSRFSEMAEQGFEHHEWLSAVDEVTRDTHYAADGEVVRIGDRFSMGLLYPQENGGPPEEVINCRCETIPVVKE